MWDLRFREANSFTQDNAASKGWGELGRIQTQAPPIPQPAPQTTLPRKTKPAGAGLVGSAGTDWSQEWLRTQQAHGPVPALPLTSCVAWGE